MMVSTEAPNSNLEFGRLRLLQKGQLSWLCAQSPGPWQVQVMFGQRACDPAGKDGGAT